MNKYTDETYVNSIFQKLYPIGSIYLSTNSINPSTLFEFGKWEQIKDTFLLACGDNYTAGSVGGEANHKLTTSETPSHAHTRGTMNIKGQLSERPCSSSSEILNSNTSTINGGAFRTIYEGDSTQWKVTVQTSGTSTKTNNLHDFDASRSWTGETSYVGGNESHNNMPPYLAVYVWKRVE